MDRTSELKEKDIGLTSSGLRTILKSFSWEKWPKFTWSINFLGQISNWTWTFFCSLCMDVLVSFQDEMLHRTIGKRQQTHF